MCLSALSLTSFYLRSVETVVSAAVDFAVKNGTGPFLSLCPEDHTMAEVGGDISEWSTPNYLLKQDDL